MDIAYCRDCKETGETEYHLDLAFNEIVVGRQLGGTFLCSFCGSDNIQDATTLIDEAEHLHGEDG